jgi:hypothetical protein
MSTFELIKAFLVCHQYQILDEDGSDGHIAFRFQMNTIHFWANKDDEHFFFMTLPNFADVTEENIAQVKEKCHQINKEMKMVKMYILNDVILASAEIYYLAALDFNFQVKNALEHLIAAKVMYKKLEE